MDINQNPLYAASDPKKTDLRAQMNSAAFKLKEEHAKFEKKANTLLRKINMGLKDAEAKVKKGQAELNASSGELADQLGDAVVQFLVGEENP